MATSEAHRSGRRHAGRQRASGRDAAPLDRLVYQDGDISKLPVVPHDLGMTRLQHADSSLLHGHIPGNVTQKDFIRRGGSLRPLSLVEKAQRVRNRAAADGYARTFRAPFGDRAYDAAEQLHREIRKIQQRERTGGARAGGAAGAADERQERDPEGGSGETGPPPHPQTVPESEAVRGGASSSGSSLLARSLATRAGAPLLRGPAPAHHFAAGGSSSQIRRERRRAVQRQRALEANLDERKQRLVDRNLEVLQDMADQEAVNRHLAAEIERAILPQAAHAPAPKAPLHPRAGGASPTSPSASSASPSSASSASPSSASSWAIVGVAAVIAVALILAAVVLGKRGGARGRRG